LKDSRGIRREQTTSYEGYLPEAGVEPRGMAGVRRILPAETNGQDNGEASTFNLLEKILSSDNMNAAYKQVVRNKGSHGIDGMKVDELLPYLKEKGNNLIGRMSQVIGNSHGSRQDDSAGHCPGSNTHI
jgi:RNA-directed DNA polymerase